MRPAQEATAGARIRLYDSRSINNRNGKIGIIQALEKLAPETGESLSNSADCRVAEGGLPTLASASVVRHMSKTELRRQCERMKLCHSLSRYLPTSTPLAADRGQWSG